MAHTKRNLIQLKEPSPIRLSLSCKVCCSSYKCEYREFLTHDVIQNCVCKIFGLPEGDEVFYDEEDKERTPIVDYTKCWGKKLVTLCPRNHLDFEDLFYAKVFPIYSFEYLGWVCNKHCRRRIPLFQNYMWMLYATSQFPLPTELKSIIKRMVQVECVWNGWLSAHTIKLVQARSYLEEEFRPKSKSIKELKEEVKRKGLTLPGKKQGHGKDGRLIKADYIYAIYNDVIRLRKLWKIGV